MFVRHTHLLYSLLSAISLTSAASVQLGNTTLLGTEAAGLEFFGGIPFAEPPVGNLRFKPPIQKKSLSVATFDASKVGLDCLQLPSVLPSPGSSEDCLTINVLRPAGINESAALPIMAWIYGGGFIAGAASTYNGTAIVTQSVARGTPIIYVNFNYRLGPLGFPQGGEAASKKALNLGLKDQLAALQWIQDNIGAFGGDKSKVTIFGESAGATSIGVLYLNSGLENLAHAAIFESGSASTPLTFNASRRQNVWESFVNAVPECSSLSKTVNTFDCLRNVSSAEILTAFNTSLAQANEQFPWVPNIDGPGGVLPDLPSKLFAKGRFSRIPFIAGTNLDEGTLFTPTTINSSEAIQAWIVSNYTASPQDIPPLNTATQRILQLYPDDPALGSPFNTGNETFGLSSQYKRLAAIAGDLLFQSLRRLWIQSASKQGVKTFGYLFTDPPPPIEAPSYGVAHASEVFYLYPGIVPGVDINPSAENLRVQMIDYWVSFATSLDPNDGKGSDRSQWPQYSSQNKKIVQLNSQNLTVIADDYRQEQIDFINSHSVLFRH